MPNEHRLFLAKRIEDTSQVRDDRLISILACVGGTVGSSVAAHVDCDRSEAGFRDDRQLMAP